MSARVMATRRPRSPGEIAGLGGPPCGGGRRDRWRLAIRDRPGSVPWACARDPNADIRDRRPAAFQHRRHRARSDLQPAPPFTNSAGGRARVAFWTLIAPSRSEVLDLADKHHDLTAFERAVTLAWTQAQVQLHHLGVGPDEAHLFQRIANHVIYANPTMRPSSDVLKRSERGPSTLWAHGISGDLPIVLVRIDEIEDREIVRQLVRAHEYWRMKQLDVDLVILNERPASYDQDLQASLEALVRANQSRTRADGRSGARSSICLALRSDLGRGAQPAADRSPRGGLEPPREPRRAGQSPGGIAIRQRSSTATQVGAGERAADIAAAATSLEFFNGLGGFAADGREYVTILREGQWTPAPWINVIANPSFGFQVSALGSGYTWSINSRENQLTPWSNDPVSDTPGEVIYVRDEDTGALWGPTALPIREEACALHCPAWPGL